MNTCRKMAVAAALAAAFASPAFAASSSFAELTNFSYTLVDLDLNDGIAASLTWTYPSAADGSYANSYAYDNSTTGTSDSHFATGTFGSVSSAVSQSLSQASSSVTPGGGTDPLLGASLQSSGSTDGVTVPGTTSGYDTYAESPWSLDAQTFSLSANTVVIFQADSWVNAATTVGFDPTTGATEWASGSTFMRTYGGYVGDWQDISDTAGVYAAFGYDSNTNTWLGESGSQTGLLQVSFINYGSSALDGKFYAAVTASGASTVAAIPEPETYAMLLAGLGLIGRIARRRQAA